MWHVRNDKAKCVQLLLLNSINGSQCYSGQSPITPLHVACLFERHECAQLLLMNDQVDPNAEDQDKCTALHVACQRGNNAKCVKYAIYQTAKWTPMLKGY